jgi:hypothetical protein
MGRKKLYTDEELRERKRAQNKARNKLRHYTPEQRAANRAKERAYQANRTAAQTGGTHILLGGAERASTKPRGFIEAWRPQPKTEALLGQVKAILEEYRDHLPLTIRQIFYRLVGAHSYEKTDLAYGEIVGRDRLSLASLAAENALASPGFFGAVGKFICSICSGMTASLVRLQIRQRHPTRCRRQWWWWCCRTAL